MSKVKVKLNDVNVQTMTPSSNVIKGTYRVETRGTGSKRG